MFVTPTRVDHPYMTELDRRSDVATAVSAAFVLGLEPAEGPLSIGDYQVALQRLERAVRPWDIVVALAPRIVGIWCQALSGGREVDAIAARLADVVRAPMAVGDDVRTVGVCVGSALVEPGEDRDAAFDRAALKMHQMRAARATLVAPELPRQRVVLP
jgi:hypothetical protein